MTQSVTSGIPTQSVGTIKKLPLDLVEKIVQDPEIDFTVVPQRTFIYAEKLQELGVLKNKAASWKDYFFEEAHGGNGS